MTDESKLLINFIHMAEGLKNELRHGYTSNNKRESVAEHTWRVSLMVLLFANLLDKKISVEKALKLSIVHDIAELITGDTPYFIHEQQPHLAADKAANELKALEQIKTTLPKELGEEIYSLWKEYEDGISYEAKMVKALDKIEAQIQHNEMDYLRWNDHDRACALTRLDKYCEFDSFLKRIKTMIQEESRQKMNIFNNS